MPENETTTKEPGQSENVFDNSEEPVSSVEQNEPSKTSDDDLNTQPEPNLSSQALPTRTDKESQSAPSSALNHGTTRQGIAIVIPKIVPDAPSREVSASPTPSLASSRALHRARRDRSLSPEHGEDQVIDVDRVTMADLCKDIHIGRKSKAYQQIIDFKAREKARKRDAVLETDDVRLERIKLEEEAEAERRKNAQNLIERGPQLRIVDGQITVDEDSLRVDRHKRDAVDRRPEDVEVTEEYSRRVNSASWSKRERVERWSITETMKFYDSLSMWGTDFGLITQMFPGRSRRQIKNKFNAEERRDPTRIRLALNNRLPVDEALIGTK
ncbi:hypothetical protein V1512DRAFT_222084 [Lipomyces arxii]|uniref:uncharacterized protein n=1 Tax=Lipomyces arxii TaxID=56418 RepID=UPI0034CE72F3